MKFEKPKLPKDYLPKKIQGISGISFETKKLQSQIDFNPALVPTIEDIDEKTASSALKGFMPFAEDPEKQSRYTKYLRYCLDKTDKSNIPKSALYSDEREREEFIMSAQIFKPASSIISARFESSSATLQPQVHLIPGLSRPDKSKQPSLTTELTNDLRAREQTSFDGPKKSTADTDRMSFLWSPNPLLCKRFNVSPPEVGITGTLESKPVKPVLSDESVEQLVNTILKDSKSKIQFESSGKNSNIQEDQIPTMPASDLFDEIFGSSISATTTTKADSRRSKSIDYFGDD